MAGWTRSHEVGGAAGPVALGVALSLTVRQGLCRLCPLLSSLPG